MTEGGTPRRSPARLLPIVAVAVALVAGLAAWQVGRDDGDAERDDLLPPVAVTSDAPRLGSLEELVARSDLVVRAQVVGTGRGRVFGDPGGEAAIESRVVTLQVTRVLRGPATGLAAPGDRILVEEEGWTADGAPLIVDGARPSEHGDDAIWFLAGVGAEEEARYVVVSAEGRYLVDGDRLAGASGDDPPIAELAALGAAGLEAAVTAAP